MNNNPMESLYLLCFEKKIEIDINKSDDGVDVSYDKEKNKVTIKICDSINETNKNILMTKITELKEMI